MTRIDFRLAVSAALLVAVLAYVGCTTNTTVSPSSPSAPPSAPLANLGNPAAVLIVSGEQEGYMEPCGCSAEQIGGLIRRYDFVERLHNQNWPTALIELGTLIKDPAVRGEDSNRPRSSSTTP